MPGSVEVDGSIGVVGVIVPESVGVDIVEPGVAVPRLLRFDFFIVVLVPGVVDIVLSGMVVPGVVVCGMVVWSGIDDGLVDGVVVCAKAAPGIISAAAAAIGSIFMSSLLMVGE